LSNDTVKDPLAVGLGSLAGGVGFGAAFLTAVQVFASILRGNLESTVYGEVAKDPLGWAMFGAAGIGAACGWYRSGALDNIWQRGVIAVLAAVGALLIGFLAAILDRFFGPLGLIVWLLLNVAFGILATRWAIRGKGEAGSGSGTA
jgi:hypothetical protein